MNIALIGKSKFIKIIKMVIKNRNMVNTLTVIKRVFV